ncbi:MAG: hypothetical protein M1820_004747 [Bogoriella megaspora]|nr:MAG: hypothetical protein M1820_004747 [Bogoriella megaspora]
MSTFDSTQWIQPSPSPTCTPYLQGPDAVFDSNVPDKPLLGWNETSSLSGHIHIKSEAETPGKHRTPMHWSDAHALHHFSRFDSNGSSLTDNPPHEASSVWTPHFQYQYLCQSNSQHASPTESAVSGVYAESTAADGSISFPVSATTSILGERPVEDPLSNAQQNDDGIQAPKQRQASLKSHANIATEQIGEGNHNTRTERRKRSPDTYEESSEDEDSQSETSTQPQSQRVTRGRPRLPTKRGEEDIDAARLSHLERNRRAASRHRRKKKQWISNLDTRARQLQRDKDSLNIVVNALREQVLSLRELLLNHSNCRCEHIRNYLHREVDMITQGPGDAARMQIY